MFAFTKQQKLIKTLKDITNAYDTLSNEKNLDKDPYEICMLKNEKRDIDKEKLAIHYDAVKMEIENFDVILSTKDLWKIQKPEKAEGMVFGVSATYHETLNKSGISSGFITAYDRILREYYRAIREEQSRVGRMGLERFFRLAIEKKIKEDEKQKRIYYWKTLTGEDEEPSIESFIFSTLLKALKANVLYIKDEGNIDDVLLRDIAKYHKINIGIIK